MYDEEEQQQEQQSDRPFRQPDFDAGMGVDQAVTMAGIAALLQPVSSAVDELRKEVRGIDGNITDLNANLSERLESLE